MKSSKCSDKDLRIFKKGRKVKNKIKLLVNFLINLTIKTRLGLYVLRNLNDSAMGKFIEISHADINLKIVTPNPLCEWRAQTFSSKEPETLEWIDSFEEKSVVWDIGANVGLYSMYAAKKRKCLVWSYEPSVFNLELLARNIFINGLHRQICIVPFALSEQIESSSMKMTTTEWGGALSTFGENLGWDGKEVNEVFEFKTIGLSMDDAKALLKIPQPDYIKMDVDGLEHFILKGGKSVLSLVKGVLIEVNDDFYEQAQQCHQILSQSGLALKEKRQSDYIASNTGGFQNSFNQIWARV
jgi:FkbM family methyltransferase